MKQQKQSQTEDVAIGRRSLGNLICILGGMVWLLALLFRPMGQTEQVKAQTVARIAPEEALAQEIPAQEAEALAQEIPAQETEALTQEIPTQEIPAQKAEAVSLLTSEQIWLDAYHSMVTEEGFSEETMYAMAIAKANEKELQLLKLTGDHLVTYDGERFVISEDDYQLLLRIVEAEAPQEDRKGKLLVANVVLNRVLWKTFPNTVAEVILQKGQFSPVASGSVWKVTVSDATVEAVEAALAGEDASEGALFFMARSLANPNNVSWFDRELQPLFKHGVHEFFKYWE